MMKYVCPLLFLVSGSASARTPLYSESERPARPKTPAEKSASWNWVSKGNPVTLPAKQPVGRFELIRAGDAIAGRIETSVVAFSDYPSDVIAYADSRAGRVTFFGQSRIDPNTKRTVIEFQRLSFRNETFETKAFALGPDGQPGIEGEVSSNERGIFAANLLAGISGGVANRQNANPTLEQQGTSAAAESARKSALNFAERSQQSKEYSVSKGPIRIGIQFETDPVKVSVE